jgi:Carboxypeptidase regulatory-like domain/TonB dependent receptor
MKKLAISIALLLIVAARISFAQAGFGTLAGVISDSSGAVVSHATITLTAPDGIERNATSNASGEYQFTALTVGGGFSMVVTAPGFETAKVTGVATSVGTVITQNVTLQPGSNSQTITVTAAAVEQVQTDTSSVSQLVDSTIWKDSPLEARSQNDFVYLTAGAALSGDVAGGTGRGAAVNGSRSGTGNFLVEGMDNNDQGQGGAGSTMLGSNGKGGGAVTTISPDAIQEYRVISHNPSAEYGRAGGFATDTSLKSGTNKWHGSLFEYNRVQALAAEHFFSNFGGVKDSLVRNQFGGSVGGPIHKDTTFFFATVEIHRLRTTAPVTNTTTTQAFLNFVDSGQFENFQENDPSGVCMQNTGAACPGALNLSAHLGSNFKSLLAAEPRAFPLGTQNATTTGAGLYTSGQNYPVPVYADATQGQSSPFNQERGSFKLDQKLSDRDQLSFTYLIDFEENPTAFAAGGAVFGPDEDQVGGSQLFTGNWTHTFSPTLQNLFRLGYTRHVSNFSAPSVPGVPMIVTFDPLEEGFGASSAIPQLFTDNEFLYEDSLTKYHGNHGFKAGFRYIRTRNGSSFFNDVTGSIEPWDVEDLVSDETFGDQVDRVLFGGPTYGSIAAASASIDTTTNQIPNVYRGFRANEFAAYFQDDWKVMPRLTLNLGLRWEYFGPPHNAVPGYDSNVYFGSFSSPTPNGNPFLPNAPIVGAIQGATFIQKNSNIWNKDTNNFGPRFGFSYDPTGNGTVAIRGGFGIGFDRLYNNVYENIRFNPPRFSDNTIGVGAGSSVVAGALEQPQLLNIPFNANSLFSAYGGLPNPRHIDQRLVTAYYEQANLGVEYQLAKGYVVEANYIGTFGRKLVGLEDANNYDGRTSCSSAPLSAACVAAGFTAPVSARPNLSFNADNFRTNGFSSNYNGLQASVRKSFSNGLMLLANYTYSKSMDIISDVFTTKGGQTTTSDPDNPSYDYGPADFDVRHHASITANYESQWKKENLLLGGWGISPIITMSSGSPFSVYSTAGGYNPVQDGITDSGANRVPYIGQGNQKNAVHHNVNLAKGGYLNPSDFSVATATQPLPYLCPGNVNHGLWCEAPAGRNSFYGPSYYNVDLGVFKRFPIWEAQTITFQASFFNILNHTNFANPVSDLNSGSFGASIASADPRITQLSLRYDF